MKYCYIQPAVGCLSWANLRCSSLSWANLRGGGGGDLREMGLFDFSINVHTWYSICWYQNIGNYSLGNHFLISGNHHAISRYRELISVPYIGKSLWRNPNRVLSPCSMESSSQWSTRPAARLIDWEDSHTIQMIFTSNKNDKYDFISNVLKYGNKTT